MKKIKSYKNREFVGVAELAEQVKDVLEFNEISQLREGVAQFPSIRAIRYYLSEGLLPPALSNEGTASVFGYQHLLTLLVIKHLQSQGLPVSVIKRVIAATPTIDALEKLLNEPIEFSFDPNDAILAHSRRETVVLISDQDDVKNVLDLKFEERDNIKSEPVVWKRFKLSESIEINIAESAGFDNRRERKLIREIKNILHKI